MPPRRKKQGLPTHSQHPSQVVPIEEPMAQDHPNDPVPAILSRLESACKLNPQSLQRSLMHMLLRVCGLKEMLASVDHANPVASLHKINAHINEKKARNLPQTTPIMDHKSKGYQMHLKSFFQRMVSGDVSIGANEVWNTDLFSWVGLLLTCHNRCVRVSALHFTKLYLEAASEQARLFMDQKKSRLSNKVYKEIHNILMELLLPRLSDIDPAIRHILHEILQHLLLEMETELVDEQELEKIFIPLLKHRHRPIVDEALNTILKVTKKMKKLVKPLMSMLGKNRKQLNKLSVLPNQFGLSALKLMTELNHKDKSLKILAPDHLNLVFELYAHEEYSKGLSFAVQAFFSCLHDDQEALIDNRTSVCIDIMYLISRFDSSKIQDIVIRAFMRNRSPVIDRLFVIEEVFPIMLQGQYRTGDDTVSLSKKELSVLLRMISQFSVVLKENIHSLEGLENEKFKSQRERWQECGQKYNQQLLGNVRYILHEKMTMELRRQYLGLIREIVLPCSAAFKKEVEFIFDSLLKVFQVETDTNLIYDIAWIYRSLGIEDPSQMVKVIPESFSQASALKRLALVHFYQTDEYLNPETVDLIGEVYKHADEGQVKMMAISACNFLHRRKTTQVIRADEFHEDFQGYLKIQNGVINFLIRLLQSRQQVEFKQAAAECIFSIFMTISNDTLREANSKLFYEPTDDQFKVIYQFIDHEIGIPLMGLSEDSEEHEVTRFINRLSLNSQHKNQTINRLFDVYEHCSKIMANPVSMEVIASALMAEEEPQDANKADTTLNVSDDNKVSVNAYYAREKLATRLINKLVNKEVARADGRYFFWPLVKLMIRDLKINPSVMGKVVKKMTGLYFKKKLNTQQGAISLNKAILFLVDEVDTIENNERFDDLEYYHELTKKLCKKINKQTLVRLSHLLKEKEKLSETEPCQKLMELINNQIKKIDKVTKKKSKKSKKEEESGSDSESSSDEELEERSPVNERALMRASNPNGPQTRSRAKQRGGQYIRVES